MSDYVKECMFNYLEAKEKLLLAVEDKYIGQRLFVRIGDAGRVAVISDIWLDESDAINGSFMFEDGPSGLAYEDCWGKQSLLDKGIEDFSSSGTLKRLREISEEVVEKGTES